jgi:hypothetical protein
MKYLYVALFFVGFLFASNSVVVSANAEEVNSGVEDVSNKNPHLEPLFEYATALVEGLEENDLRIIYEIRNGFGTTRSVRVVHADVKKAIGMCAKENQDLKETLETNFSDWEKDVIGTLEKVEEKVENLITSQTTKPEDEVREYLRLTKVAADYSESQIEKIPVTDEKACKSLLNSLENTQQVLVDLLSGLEFSSLNKEEPSEKLEEESKPE